MLVELAQRQVDRAGKVRRGVIIRGQYLDDLRSAVDQLLQLFQPNPRGHGGVTVAQVQTDVNQSGVMALVSFRVSELVNELANTYWRGVRVAKVARFDR